ncbi:MAG: SDR family NAD(P)-dependent oxidoreductase [Deltaproteobacteria bacterium]|nr:SDR family NAD(P)-dependent oxidoreductase [Deltaproteobacteria bacterium]MBW2140589.1 SDR family NAD(P)-dependent oxidoreductase [Deltaproteobacteria bacterium]
MQNLKDKVAAVTGAASGIGRMLAVNLAKEGCEVAIADLDQAGLEETANMIDDKKIKVSTHLVDVANRDQVYQFADDVQTQHNRVDIIINNAGVGLSETLEDVKYEDFDWLLGINLWGVIYGSKAFLPYLKQRPEANIVNISSVHGLFTNRNVGPYCTSKFAVRGFTLALTQELKNTSVKVSCVHPGGIKTNIVRNTRFYKGSNPDMTHADAVAGFDKLAHTSADKAAQIIIRGVKKNKARILVGFDAHVYALTQRLFPNLWQRLMSRL